VTIKIRVARPDDAEALADVAAVTFPLACPPTARPESIVEFVEANLSRERFERYVADPHRTVLLGESRAGDGGADPTVLGYAMLVSTADGAPQDVDIARAVRCRPTIELSKLYVRPERHGGSVAAPLLDAVLARATDAGSASVWLGVNGDNARAQRFYAKRGFEQVGVRTFVVGREVHDDLVLERPLETLTTA
jgi:ribosomal protein S18 acetylase RimI-like enzyme